MPPTFFFIPSIYERVGRVLFSFIYLLSLFLNTFYDPNPFWRRSTDRMHPSRSMTTSQSIYEGRDIKTKEVKTHDLIRIGRFSSHDHQVLSNNLENQMNFLNGWLWNVMGVDGCYGEYEQLGSWAKMICRAYGGKTNNSHPRQPADFLSQMPPHNHSQATSYNILARISPFLPLNSEFEFPNPRYCSWLAFSGMDPSLETNHREEKKSPQTQKFALKTIQVHGWCWIVAPSAKSTSLIQANHYQIHLLSPCQSSRCWMKDWGKSQKPTQTAT